MTSQCYTTARHAHSREGVGRAGALTARDLGHVSLFVAGLTDARIAAVVEYTNFEGERWAYPLWQQMLHQVNHATQHRSEAAMLLTRLGHSPGWLDYIYFIDVEAAQSTG